MPTRATTGATSESSHADFDAATLIGGTQMFGMAGGSAGQFVIGPMIGAGVSWSTFWFGMGIGGPTISALLLVLLPKSKPVQRRDEWLKPAVRA